MPWGFVIQTTVSAAAIAGLVVLVAWARIAAARPALDTQSARAVLAEEFPDAEIEGVWTAADGRSALAKAGDQALIVYLRGDDYVSRVLGWDKAAMAPVETGAVRLPFNDITAPTVRLALGANGAWPPALEATA